MLFFENGKTGADARWVPARGYWYNGSGKGLSLPSDLEAVDQDADKWDEEWTLWLSSWQRRYFCLRYDPQSTEWLGVKIHARSPDQARAEMNSMETEQE